MTTDLRILSTVAFRGAEVTSARLRGLLALLAAGPRAGVSAGRLADELWRDDQPENPAKALQVLVSRARAQVGADVIASTPTGYRLALRDEQIDAAALLLHAAESAQSARVGDQHGSLDQADRGLALWDGTADPESDDPVEVLRRDRQPTYWALVRARALALARLDRADEAVGPLTGLAAEYPRDEEILAELLRAEAATAGPATALARYDAYRRRLRAELGADPGAQLRAVHQRLLQAEAPVVREGIAHEPNELLGRDADIAAVRALIAASRVTSIVGPGGLGKTRLANVVARDAEQHLVQFVALAGVTHDDDVAAEVASALGVRDTRSPGGPVVPADMLAGIVGALAPGPALLVLDNCEQVVGGVAELARGLVALSRDLRILTTSRIPLGLSSEAVHALPELNLATTVELFRRRAVAARPGVELPEPVVEELCRRLDGLPLAVELAAARVRVLSVPDIAARLADRFALLRGGSRDTPERHRTLQEVVDWSWNLLDPRGQAALRALSFFPNGFTAEGAAHLVGDDALGILENLAEQSLVKATDTPSGVRFRMLETVREFAAARRASAEETEQITAAFLAWSRAFGHAHYADVLGADPVPVLQRVGAERDNLLHALRLGLAAEDGRTVAAVSAVLGSLWTVESDFTRMQFLAIESGRVLSHFRPGPDDVEITRNAVILPLATTFLALGPRATRALVVLRRLPPPQEPGTLQAAISTVLCAIPEISGPDDSALRAMRAGDDPWLAGIAAAFAAYRHQSLDEPEPAIAAAHEMAEAFAGPEFPMMRIMALGLLGELALQVGRGEDAVGHFAAALRVLERLGERKEVVGVRWGMVLAQLQAGDADATERWLRIASADLADDDHSTHTFVLGVRAEVALSRGYVDEGLALWREAVARLVGGTTAELLGDPVVGPWGLQLFAVVVVAHARHGALDAVRDLVGTLPRMLVTALRNPLVKPPPSIRELPICGAILLALAVAELAAEDGDRTWAARAIALAERLQFLRGFQPTMRPGTARTEALDADRPAYEEAVSSYAGVGRDSLRASALELLSARGWD